MGTQTSKPLFGDEERRNRFRRPRTPVNNSSSAPTAPTDNLRTWPCANCHATVSNDNSRCPYCGGIQVKVKIPRSPLSATKAINSNLLLERLAATPTTPVKHKEIDSSRLQAFLSESATTSTMEFEDEDDEEEEVEEQKQQEERPASALSQASSLSQNFNFPIQQPQAHRQLPSPPIIIQSATSPAPSIESIPARVATPVGPQQQLSYHDRPPDPVALTLEAVQLRSGAPSPQIAMFEKERQQQVQQQMPPPSPESSVTKRKASISGFEAPKKKMVLPPSS